MQKHKTRFTQLAVAIFSISVLVIGFAATHSHASNTSLGAPSPVQSGSATIILQQGLNSYTGAKSVEFNDLRYQGISQTTHFYRYDGSNRYYNLEYFDLGNTSSWGSVTNAQLIFYKVGGNVYTPSTIYARRINDPDAQGMAYPTGWKVAASDGYRNGANMESRDNTASPHVKWKASDPTTSSDTNTDYFQNILQPVTSSPSFSPTDAAPVGTAYTLDVTSDVECFRAGTCRNEGWATWHNATANIQFVIGNSNYSNVSYRPKLVITYTVGNPTAPVISSFTASPSSITSGAPTTLSWSVSNATSVVINQGIGGVTSSGAVSVNPSSTTTYTLTATNGTETRTNSVTVTVTPVEMSNYYVSTSGSDSADGSSLHPWRHIQYAVDHVLSNSSIIISPGTYTESVMFDSTDIRSAISLGGIHGARAVILDGTGQANHNGIEVWHQNDITIHDLVISNHGTSPNYNNGFGIVWWYGTHGMTIKNVEIRNVNAPIKLAAVSDGNRRDLIDIEDVYAHDYSQAGIDIGTGPSSNITAKRIRLIGTIGGNDTGIDGFAIEDATGVQYLEDIVVRGHSGDGLDCKADNVTAKRIDVRYQARNGIKLWRRASTIEDCYVASGQLLADAMVVASDQPLQDGSYTVRNSTFMINADPDDTAQTYLTEWAQYLSSFPPGSSNIVAVTSQGNTFHADWRDGYVVGCNLGCRIQSASDNNTFSGFRQNSLFENAKNASGAIFPGDVSPAVLNAGPGGSWATFIGNSGGDKFSGRVPTSRALNRRMVLDGESQYASGIIATRAKFSTVTSWENNIDYAGLRRDYTDDQVIEEVTAQFKLVFTGTSNPAGANKFQLTVYRDSNAPILTHDPSLMTNRTVGRVRVIFDATASRYRIETENTDHTGFSSSWVATTNASTFNFSGASIFLGVGDDMASNAQIKIDQVQWIAGIVYHDVVNNIALWTFDDNDGVDLVQSHSNLVLTGKPLFENALP